MIIKGLEFNMVVIDEAVEQFNRAMKAVTEVFETTLEPDKKPKPHWSVFTENNHRRRGR